MAPLFMYGLNSFIVQQNGFRNQFSLHTYDWMKKQWAMSRGSSSDIHKATSEKNEKKFTCYNFIQCGAGFDYIFVVECESISID